MEIGIDPAAQPTWLIEGAMANASDGGAWLQVFRTTTGQVYGSASYDDGQQWSPAVPLPVPNPNSKVQKGTGCTRSPSICRAICPAWAQPCPKCRLLKTIYMLCRELICHCTFYLA